MNKNEGSLDRTVRIVVGLGLIAAAATGTVGAWAYVGVIPVITGSLGWCPLYTLLGVSTCPTQK
jgi:hypothetical protein